jgi:uncharacterized membrane protein YphA (DoxX/SURF4 family)/uncharacterized small protein (DUF1192 family)
MKGSTKVLLVLLRLAIGWHFFFEGLDKIRSVDLIGPTETNRPWSSVLYLREATGPAGDLFRRMAGDVDQEALALFAVRPLEPGEDPARVSPRHRISPALDQAWNEYLRRFEDKYKLTDQQKVLAEARMDQAKDQAVRWLLGSAGKQYEQEKSFGGEATVKVKQSSLERLNEYRDKVERLRTIMHDELPAFGHDVEKQRIGALKAEINRLRTELLADLEKPMQEALQTVLTPEQIKEGAVTASKRPGISEWKRMDWIDALTRYGLTLVGACLLLGLFTRSACLGGVVFLAMFYGAMPALPWLPESPRAEGHYVFINKNIIEMLALLTLATTPSGRWAGLDGLLRCLWPWNWRSRQLPRLEAVNAGSRPHP